MSASICHVFFETRRKRAEYYEFFANYDEVDFMTHSMGGIITKRMLNTLNTPTESVNLHRLRCVIYISVPSNGAEVASLASSFAARGEGFRDAGERTRLPFAVWTRLREASFPLAESRRTTYAF